MQKPLTGLGVLVTRPKHQAAAFIKRLEQSGAHAIAFPSIEIQPIESSKALDEQAQQLENYNFVIFISTNAVDHGVNWLNKAGKSLKNLKIIAIGKSTASALNKHGLKVDITPCEDFNSEALLKLAAMQKNQVTAKHLLIIRGEGGREFLADTLKSRGAQVHYAEVYRRCQPQKDTAPLLELWSKKRIQLVTVTSNDALKNLYHMMNKQGQSYLRQTDLIVPSHRCAELAQQLEFNRQVIIATSARDEDIMNAINNWHQSLLNSNN